MQLLFPSLGNSHNSALHLSCIACLQIWNRFDEDGSGSIDTDELGLFLQDVLVQADLKIELDAKKYVQTMVSKLK